MYRDKCCFQDNRLATPIPDPVPGDIAARYPALPGGKHRHIWKDQPGRRIHDRDTKQVEKENWGRAKNRHLMRNQKLMQIFHPDSKRCILWKSDFPPELELHHDTFQKCSDFLGCLLFCYDS